MDLGDIVSPADAARALGVSRQRIEQLTRAGHLTRVDITMNRHHGIPWDEVVQRAKALGTPIREVPRRLTACDVCWRPLLRAGSQHRGCVTRTPRPTCATPGCISTPNRRGNSAFCGRCRGGYAPTTVLPPRVPLYSGLPCVKCGDICKPQRAKVCADYGVPPTCRSCLAPNALQKLRKGKRSFGYSNASAITTG